MVKLPLDRRSPVIFFGGRAEFAILVSRYAIQYAILYHYGGYFVHDAPWRANFDTAAVPPGCKRYNGIQL